MQSIRIFHPSAKKWIKRGFRDFIANYVALGFATFGTVAFMYDYWNGLQLPRYKDGYTIFRPTDDFARLYPRNYITDKHLLPADHPNTLEECDGIPRGKPISDGNLYRRFSFMAK